MNPVWHFVNGTPTISAPIVMGPLVISSDTVAQRNGTNTQTLLIGPVNSELKLSKANNGSAAIGTVDAQFLVIQTANTDRWFFGPTGHFTAATDNTYDIGASGSGRPKDYHGAGVIKSYSASAGLGYGTGAGGTVTQGTSKSTAVSLNTVTGEITMHNAALNAGVSVSFTLNNTTIDAGDYVMVQHVSAGTVGSYVCQAVAGADTATVTVTNRTAGNLSEAIVLKFVVFKAVTS